MEILLALLIIGVLLFVAIDVTGHIWEYFTLFFCKIIEPNLYFVYGVFCFLSAVLYLIYFKPHKAEAYLFQYKKGLISCAEASNNIVQQMYDPIVHGAPSALKSRVRKKRAERLKRILDAETELMESISKNIKYKELGD